MNDKIFRTWSIPVSIASPWRIAAPQARSEHVRPGKQFWRDCADEVAQIRHSNRNLAPRERSASAHERPRSRVDARLHSQEVKPR